MTESESNQLPTSVECPPDKDHLVRFYIMAVMPLVFGLLCIRDISFVGKFARPVEPFAWQTANAWISWAMNYFGQFVFTGLGVVLLVCAIRATLRVLVANESGIGWKGGHPTPWESVTGVDTNKFASKKILYLLTGDDRRITLDYYKLRNYKELLQVVEQHVDAGELDFTPGDKDDGGDGEPTDKPVEAHCD